MATTSTNEEHFHVCHLCPRRSVKELSQLVPPELQTGHIGHDTWTHSWGAMLSHVDFIDADRRFTWMYQRYRAGPNKPSFCVVDLLEDRITNFKYASGAFERYGMTSTELLRRIFSHDLRRINDRLFLLEFTHSTQSIRRTFLCLLSLDACRGQFAIADWILFAEEAQSGEWRNYIRIRCDLHYTRRGLQLKSTRREGNSERNEYHRYALEEDRFVLLDRSSLPSRDYIRECGRHNHSVDENHLYYFFPSKRLERMGGEEIEFFDFSRIHVIDLSAPGETPPKVLETRCPYEELKEVSRKFGAASYPQWYEHVGYTLIFSPSTQFYQIYAFELASLKWTRIEWIRFPVNHIVLNEEDGTVERVCRGFGGFRVVLPNRILFSNAYEIEDASGEKKTHIDFYRLTIRRPDYLRDLAWSRVQRSPYKQLLRDKNQTTPNAKEMGFWSRLFEFLLRILHFCFVIGKGLDSV